MAQLVAQVAGQVHCSFVGQVGAPGQVHHIVEELGPVGRGDLLEVLLVHQMAGDGPPVVRVVVDPIIPSLLDVEDEPLGSGEVPVLQLVHLRARHPCRGSRVIEVQLGGSGEGYGYPPEEALVLPGGVGVHEADLLQAHYIRVGMARHLHHWVARLQGPRVHYLLDTSAPIQQSGGLGLVCKEMPEIVLGGGTICPEG